MTIHVETSDLSTAAVELREVLDAFDITQCRAARWFDVAPRSIRRWLHGSRRIPRGIGIVIHLLVVGAVTADQVAKAAAAVASIPARTNGGAEPEPPAPLLVAPALETPADPGPAIATTTAAKVYGLAVGTCRWPDGDPRHPDFHFCGNPVTKKKPYCEHHHAMAYMAPPTGGGHGARIRLVAQWGHQWPKASCLKGTHHAAAPVALSVPPAGDPNRRSVR